MQNNKGKKEKKLEDTLGFRLRSGSVLSIDFFKTHAWVVLTIVVATLAMIGLRYKTKTKMAEINRLSTEYQRSESKKLAEKAAYMSLIRESSMKEMMAEQNLALEFQEQPPFEIIDDGKEETRK